MAVASTRFWESAGIIALLTAAIGGFGTLINSSMERSSRAREGACDAAYGLVSDEAPNPDLTKEQRRALLDEAIATIKRCRGGE